MSKGVRSIWAAGAGSVMLIVAMGGTALAAPVSTAAATYVDANGNHIDDSCETNVVPDPVAAAASFAAADLDGNGMISESEALQAGWIGSENCTGGGDGGGVTPPDPVPPVPAPENPKPKPKPKPVKPVKPPKAHHVSGHGHGHTQHGHGHGHGHSHHSHG